MTTKQREGHAVFVDESGRRLRLLRRAGLLLGGVLVLAMTLLSASLVTRADLGPVPWSLGNDRSEQSRAAPSTGGHTSPSRRTDEDASRPRPRSSSSPSPRPPSRSPSPTDAPTPTTAPSPTSSPPPEPSPTTAPAPGPTKAKGRRGRARTPGPPAEPPGRSSHSPAPRSVDVLDLLR